MSNPIFRTARELARIIRNREASASASAQDATIRPRARDLGIAPGVFSPGPFNAITDVAGVHVGHFTLVEGDDIRTGATAIIR